MRQQNYSLSEIARVLCRQPYQVTYALTTGRIPEPKRFAGRRQFSEADLKRLTEYFQGREKKETNEIQDQDNEGS